MTSFFTAQHFAIDLTGAASNTATISAVTTSRAHVVRNSWQNPAGSDSRSDWVRVALTSTTLATASRDGTTGNIIAYGSVLEWDASAIQSIQTGTISIGTSATSNTATISSVTKNNAVAIFLGCEAPAGGSTTHQYYDARVALTNGTTVTATVASALSTTVRTVGFVVVEWVSGVLQQAVQHLSLSTTTTSSAHTVTAVTIANSILFHNGNTGTDENGNKTKLSLTTTTNVQADKAVSVTTPVEAALVEFVSGKITAQHNLSQQHAQNDQTKDGTITSVDRTRAFINFAGYWTNGDEPDEARIGLAFTSDTNVRSYRGGASTSASTDTSNVGYQVIEAQNLTGDVTATPTGVSGTGAVGTPTITGTANVPVTGVSGTGAAGTPTVNLLLVVSVTGVAGTGAVGNPTITGDANVPVTGVAGTGAVGNPTITGTANVPITGVSGAGAAGEVTVTTDSAEDTTALPQGVSGAGAAGTPTITGDANVPVTGVAGAGAAGDVTVQIAQDVTVLVTGVQGVGAAGEVTIDISDGEQPVARPQELAGGTFPFFYDRKREEERAKQVREREEYYKRLQQERREALEKAVRQVFSPPSPVAESVEEEIVLPPLSEAFAKIKARPQYELELLLLTQII